MPLGIPVDWFSKHLNVYSAGLNIGFITVYLEELSDLHAR